VFILVFAAIGSFLLYKSHAASVNTNDEVTQYYNINETRYVAGLAPLQTSVCLNKIAEKWSQTMANAQNLYHNPNLVNQISTSAVSSTCNIKWSGIAENIGKAGSNCNVAACSQIIYKNFLPPSDSAAPNYGDHYKNILSTSAGYVGVGAYMDDHYNLWITQDFVACGCSMTTYNPAPWLLSGTVTASTATAARATNINVRAGAVVSWYHNIRNLGSSPSTANYQWYIHSYHYSASGALASSAATTPVSVTTAPGGVYVNTNNATIPATAAVGEKYCQTLYITNPADSSIPGVLTYNSLTSLPGTPTPDSSGLSCVTVR